MARGQEAKSNVISTIKAAFGEDYLGTEDGKKFYVQAPEGGQKVQVAITLTCPKVGLSKECATGVEPDSEIGESERAQINDLMEKLGL